MHIVWTEAIRQSTKAVVLGVRTVQNLIANIWTFSFLVALSVLKPVVFSVVQYLGKQTLLPEIGVTYRRHHPPEVEDSCVVVVHLLAARYNLREQLLIQGDIGHGRQQPAVACTQTGIRRGHQGDGDRFGRSTKDTPLFMYKAIQLINY